MHFGGGFADGLFRAALWPLMGLAALCCLSLGARPAEAGTLSPGRFDNARAGGFATMEILPDKPDKPGGTKGSEKPAPIPRLFVPLKRTEVRGDVAGPLVRLRQIQTYGFSSKEFGKTVAALYRFPLPGDAAVTDVRVRFGDAEITATLKEREKAKKEYDEAVKAGNPAALLTREAPDVFTLAVAGIRPDQDVTVETRFVQLARPEGERWSLRIPLTVVPRYVRSDELESRHAQGQPLAVLRDPGHRFSLDLSFRGVEDVKSPTHELRRQAAPDGGERVLLAQGEVIPDRDCVLTWSPPREPGRASLTLFRAEGPGGAKGDAKEGLFLALVAPAETKGEPATAPREAVLLVDHSGSMQGAKWAAADWAAKKFLRGLNDRETFNLCLFHNTTRWYAPRPVKATRAEVDRAIRFLEEHRDDGGTELGVALEQALSQARTKGAATRRVLVVTDAQVSDQGRILRLADGEFARPDRRRIDLLCVDAAPNSLLARQLAERGGGIVRFLTSSPEEEDVTTALDEVLADGAAPVLAGLRLESTAPFVVSGRRPLAAGEKGWRAADLGDLPAGRAIWVVGRLPKEDPEARFRLAAQGLKEPLEAKVLRADPEEARAIRALYGAGQTLGIEFLISSGLEGRELEEGLTRLGYDPVTDMAPAGGGKKVYAENARGEAAARLKGLLVRESLRYGAACSETAFVAVRKEKGKPVEAFVPVGNALASGWSEEFLSAGAPMPAPAGGSGGFFLFRKSAPAPMAPVYEAADGNAGAPAPISPAPSDRATIFSGAPALSGGEATLFDSGRKGEAARLPKGAAVLSELFLSLKGRVDPARLAGATLEIYLEDPSLPRAKVSLKDLLDSGGTRPLNLNYRPGKLFRVVLRDPGGALSGVSLSLGLAW